MIQPPETGVAEELEPGVRRVLAPNPSPMTHWGTNSYIVGWDEVAVIDPGPDDPAHLAALLAALRGARVGRILVTHAHRDHSGLAARLSRETGAPVVAFGPPEAGRSPRMVALAAQGLAGGGEGVDAGLRPDAVLAPDEAVEGTGWRLTAHWTPGHFSGHLSFSLADIVFTGDHVMGWASTLISPPDGDVSAFLASCEALLARDHRVFHPGHGAPVTATHDRLSELIRHRRGREAAIRAALADGARTVAAIAEAVYHDTPAALRPAAERNVFAHLVDLVEKGEAHATPDLTPRAAFRPTP